MSIYQGIATYQEWYGRLPDLLFVSEEGFSQIEGDLQVTSCPVYPVIGTYLGRKVFYIADMPTPYLWVDALVMENTTRMSIPPASMRADYLNVRDLNRATPVPKITMESAVPTELMVEKLHQIPVCVIKAYKEYLCN